MPKKRIVKNKSHNIEKQKYLKIYLQQRSYSLKDLKCEVILMICDMLIENYLIAEDIGNTEVLISDITSNEKSIINETMKNLQKNIQENILTIDKIQNIINSQDENNKSSIQAKLAESTQFFYNICANNLKILIISNSTDENNKIKWVPDLICTYLIQDMIENGYLFTKFTFLDKCNFDNLFRIYGKTNILLKKNANMPMLSKEKTIIDIMANVSYELVSRLINAKYK